MVAGYLLEWIRSSEVIVIPLDSRCLEFGERKCQIRGYDIAYPDYFPGGRFLTSICTVAVMPAARAIPDGTSSIWIATGMR
jgi:hypothetical protein